MNARDACAVLRAREGGIASGGLKNRARVGRAMRSGDRAAAPGSLGARRHNRGRRGPGSSGCCRAANRRPESNRNR
jgi:hypothetical protein